VKTRGVVSLCLSGLTLGGLGVTVSLLSSEGVSAFSQTFWRFNFAAIVFLTVSAVTFRAETIPGKRELVIVGAGGGMMLFASLTYMGAIYLGLPVPNVSFLSQMSAVLTILFAVPLLGERLTRPKIAAVSFGTAGVFLISQPWRAGGGNLAAEFLVVLNAVNFALFTIFNREFVHKRRYKPQLVSTWVFCGAALWSLPLLALNLVRLPTGSAPDEPFLLLSMAFVSTFLPYSLMNAGLKRVDAGDASVILLLSPLSSTVLSYAILGEKVGLLTGIGSAFIALSVALLAIYESKQKPSSEAEN
jgi:drug/metabolite transporter (DMT)-like permease